MRLLPHLRPPGPSDLLKKQSRNRRIKIRKRASTQRDHSNNKRASLSEFEFNTCKEMAKGCATMRCLLASSPAARMKTLQLWCGIINDWTTLLAELVSSPAVMQMQGAFVPRHLRGQLEVFVSAQKEAKSKGLPNPTASDITVFSWSTLTSPLVIRDIRSASCNSQRLRSNLC